MTATKELIGRKARIVDRNGKARLCVIRRVVRQHNEVIRLHCVHPDGYGFMIKVAPEELGSLMEGGQS